MTEFLNIYIYICISFFFFSFFYAQSSSAGTCLPVYLSPVLWVSAGGILSLGREEGLGCSICMLAALVVVPLLHILPLIDEEYPCSGQGGVGGVGQFSHSGVVDEASDKQHEAWAANRGPYAKQCQVFSSDGRRVKTRRSLISRVR